jgi:hypothetical protein
MRMETHGQGTFCLENHTKNPHTGEWMCSVPIHMMNREPFVRGCARCDERKCLVISAHRRENRLCIMAVVIIFAILVSFACWQNQPTKVDGAGSSSGATAGSAWHRGGGSTPPTIPETKRTGCNANGRLKDHACAETGRNCISVVVYHRDSDNALSVHICICTVFSAPRQ